MIRGLYGIADAGFGDPLALGTLLLDGGASVIQLRCKGWSVDDVAAAARLLHPLCRQRGVPLILNDHLALAEAGLGDGVHLGQGDGPFDRSRLPPSCIVGRSTHDLEQLRAAESEGADYVGFGPVYRTGTKPGIHLALPPRGLADLRRLVAAAQVPVVAIGGITPANLHEVQSTRVEAWAVISGVLSAVDPLAAARKMSKGAAPDSDMS